MPANLSRVCSSGLASGVAGPQASAGGRWRRQGLRLIAGVLVAAGLAGCAGSVALPTVVTALPADQRASLHLAGVTTEAAMGVVVPAIDTNRITQYVIASIQEAAPGLIDPAAPQKKAMRIVITRYDEGNAGARFLLAGLGQIRLDGDVIISDAATGQKVAEYKVSKQFSFGGLYGGLTSMQDVEQGFAKSVAALVKPGS